MATFDRDHIERLLDERLASLQRTRAGIIREGEGMLGGELAQIDNHPGDMGTETFERELDQTTQVFLAEEERRIADARRALANGTYGTCASCGAEIPPARLEAMPEAVRCVSCQRGLEGLRSQKNAPRAEL